MSRLMPALSVLVGLGLGGGFGAIAVDSLLDYRAFPKTPTPVTVAQLAAMKSVPRGTWVRVVDAKPDCDHGFAKPHETSYVLMGEGHAVIGAFERPPPCRSWKTAELTGVPSLHRTVEGAPGKEMPNGLAPSSFGPQRWPDGAVILWTWSGPHDSRTGIWLGGGFALLGVFLTWYGVRGLRPRIPDAVVVDPDQFPSTVQLTKRAGATLPATVVWLPVLRVEAVKARGITTDVTLYELALPATVSPLATRARRTLSAHTGPGVAGLIFRSPERDAVAAARPAGSEELVVIRSDLAELELSRESRAALRARLLS